MLNPFSKLMQQFVSNLSTNLVGFLKHQGQSFQAFSNTCPPQRDTALPLVTLALRSGDTVTND